MDETYTAEQLRRDAIAIERMHGETLTVEWRGHQASQLRAHADALEENARLKAAWDASHKQAMKNGAACNEWRDRANRAEAGLATLREQLSERDAEIAALKAHAEALRNRLVEEYTIGPCVDQTVGAALPHEVYDFDAAYPKE